MKLSSWKKELCLPYKMLTLANTCFPESTRKNRAEYGQDFQWMWRSDAVLRSNKHINNLQEKLSSWKKELCLPYSFPSSWAYQWMFFAQLSTLSAHTSYYAVRCIAEFSYNIWECIHLRLGPKALMKTRLNTNTQNNESVNRTLTKTNPKFGTWRRTSIENLARTLPYSFLLIPGNMCLLKSTFFTSLRCDSDRCRVSLKFSWNVQIIEKFVLQT
jgi:hypothetical protein